MMGMRVGIIGGGIGGLTAAVALRQTGADSVVFERASARRRSGAGISLWANALTSLRMLNLEKEIVARGSPIVGGTFRTSDGKVLFEVPFQRMYPVPAVMVHRDELQEILLGVLPEEAVHFDAECVGVEQHGQEVSARFLDGRELRFDMLVGADGIRSTIRRLMLGEPHFRYSGFAAWRGVADFPGDELPNAGGNEWWGAGAIFGAAPMSGDRVYWYGEARQPEGKAPIISHKEDSLGRFRGWEPTIQAIIASTHPDTVTRYDGYDVEPAARWSTGRVTLLGDAAHPIRANLGQGGCQAIEDAVFLAGCASSTDPVQALQRYEAGRRGRATYVARLSHLMSLLEHTRGRLPRALRDAILRVVPTSLMLRSMATLLSPELPRAIQNTRPR
jgi:2-polyprenyl-6-methoxyphenol hydroxylase-like FAD-dependent oxidoreductase